MFLRPLYRRPVTDTVTDESIIFITWAFYITILIYFLLPQLILVIYVKINITEKKFPLATIVPRERTLVDVTDKNNGNNKIKYQNAIIYFPGKILKINELNEEMHLVFDRKRTAVISEEISDFKTIHPDLINDVRIKTEYDLYNESLAMTPAQMSIFDSYEESKRKSRLLSYKALYTSYGRNISKFKTKNIKGFQFGDPIVDDHVKLHIFDNNAEKHALVFSGFSQKEIDFSLISIKFD